MNSVGIAQKWNGWRESGGALFPGVAFSFLPCSQCQTAGEREPRPTLAGAGSKNKRRTRPAAAEQQAKPGRPWNVRARSAVDAAVHRTHTHSLSHQHSQSVENGVVWVFGRSVLAAAALGFRPRASTSSLAGSSSFYPLSRAGPVEASDEEKGSAGPGRMRGRAVQ